MYMYTSSIHWVYSIESLYTNHLKHFIRDVVAICCPLVSLYITLIFGFSKVNDERRKIAFLSMHYNIVAF